jgi:urease accessory protein
MQQTSSYTFAGWRCLIVPAVALIGVLATPSTAQAHLVSSGAGPFFDGVAHFFVSMDDLLVVVAIALFSGLMGKPAARWVLLTLPVAWLVGMVLSLFFAAGMEDCLWATGVTLLGSGLLLSCNPNLHPWSIASIAGVIGLLHGSWNGAAMRATETSAIASLGIVSAASVATLLLSATAVSVHVAWHRIALRVIGSWIAAFGLLALAWHFRPVA